VDNATVLLALVVLLGIAFEFVNGFHDAANAIATTVATRVLTPAQAILMAGVLNLVGALSGEAAANQRLGGSIAFAMKAVEQGAQIVRVHDVFETVQALRVWRGMRDQALTPRI